MQVDEGCSPEQPTCVDALGHDPLPGKPGVDCAAYDYPHALLDAHESGDDNDITNDAAFGSKNPCFRSGVSSNHIPDNNVLPL